MNKYLAGSQFFIPMSSDEVPMGTVTLVTWALSRVAPEDTDGSTTITGNFLAVDNPNGSITLPVANVGPRSVWQLTYTLDGNTYTDHVMIEGAESLIKGVNSFMTYFEAMLYAEEVTAMDIFKAASKEDQIAALVSAYQILCTMVFADRHGDHYDIGSYDAVQLNELEPSLLKALCIACIIEANEMLDINSIHYKRLDGLMSETIGESSMMFRPGNIANFPITRRSMNYLRNYLVIRARLYRA